MLVKYEFLKILRRRSTIAVMLVSLIITAVFFGLPVIQYQTYDGNGVHRGLEGIRYNKERYEKISVPLTNEYVAETIEEVKRLFGDPANIGYDGQEKFLVDDAYWNDIAYRENLLDLIAANFAEPNVTVGYNSLPLVEDSVETDFYQARQDKIEKIINDPSRKLSETEKEYWLKMNGNVETPLQYGYFEGWKVIISCSELFIFPILAICIILSPVFSGEYQAGTDAVVLSCRYGKTKLGTAKIAASFLFGLLAFTLHIIVAFAIPLGAYGIDGWDLPLQINGTSVPYPLTFLEGTLVNLGVVYLVLTAMIGLTLFLSSEMKSPYLVLTVVIPVLFIPMFLSPNGTAGIYNLLVFLTPYQSLIPNFASYISYQVGPAVLDSFTMNAAVYAVLTLILSPLAKTGFKKHQITA